MQKNIKRRLHNFNVLEGMENMKKTSVLKAIFLIILILWIMYLREDSIYKKRNEIYKLLQKNY